MTLAGSAFHARAPATGKARSPSEDRRVAGTTTSVLEAERSRWRDWISDTSVKSSEKYSGPMPWNKFVAQSFTSELEECCDLLTAESGAGANGKMLRDAEESAEMVDDVILSQSVNDAKSIKPAARYKYSCSYRSCWNTPTNIVNNIYLEMIAVWLRPKQQNVTTRYYTACALSLATQCIVIGPVCGFVGVCVCGWVYYHDNSKLRASLFTKLGL